MSTNANWTGTLRQIRFDPISPTGVVYVDSVEIY
jgi:hypothetical protein